MSLFKKGHFSFFSNFLSLIPKGKLLKIRLPSEPVLSEVEGVVVKLIFRISRL